jgi:hypothetical protein
MKMPLALILFLAAAGLLSAQQPQVNLGPHGNGGRGCATCHVPRSGSVGDMSVLDRPGHESLAGDIASPVDQQTSSLGGDEVQQAIPGFDQQQDEIRGIMICLSCHDGSIAKTSMLKSAPYDRRAGLLANEQSAELSGFLTRRGNLGLVGHDYFNVDHPVGPWANLGTLALNPGNVTLEVDPASGSALLSLVKNSPEAYFAANYGFPSVEKGRWSYPRLGSSGRIDPDKLFLLCITCHNPHGAAGNHISRYLLNGPYNPDAKFDPKSQAPSSTQFCRQCHFQLSNEYSGQIHIVTVY